MPLITSGIGASDRIQGRSAQVSEASLSSSDRVERGAAHAGLEDVAQRAGVEHRAAQLPDAVAGQRQVHGQHQGRVARLGGARHELRRPAAVALHVELEPARAAADRGDRLEGAVRERAQRVDEALARGHPRGGHLPFAVRQALERGRGEAHRQRDRRPQHRRRGIDAGDVDQHPRSQHASAEGGHVLVERVLVPGAARVVGVGLGRQGGLRQRLEVGEGMDVHQSGLRVVGVPAGGRSR